MMLHKFLQVCIYVFSHLLILSLRNIQIFSFLKIFNYSLNSVFRLKYCRHFYLFFRWNFFLFLFIRQWRLRWLWVLFWLNFFQSLGQCNNSLLFNDLFSLKLPFLFYLITIFLLWLFLLPPSVNKIFTPVVLFFFHSHCGNIADSRIIEVYFFLCTQKELMNFINGATFELFFRD